MSGQDLGETGLTESRKTSPWAIGFAVFAAIMMITLGFFQAIEGFVAIVRKSYYVVAPHYVFEFSVTAWGWIHLIVGIVVGVAGIFVLTGHLWARIIGIIVAVVSAITNFMFIPYYPFWSILIIILNVLVIWALCEYNREAADRNSTVY